MQSMCGISGLFGHADSDIVLSMASCLSHRGPDGINIYSDSMKNGSISLSHARLSIIDISGSNQPMGSDQGSVLIQNGEIYNYKAIKSGIRNYPWRTNGDAEVILALHHKHNPPNNTPLPIPKNNGNLNLYHTPNYSKIGNPATKHNQWIKKLDGIWGFSIWNPNQGELILSRDAMGVKPLFRTILDDGTLMFSSEIKSFYAHPKFVPKPNIKALYARLSYEYTIDRTTLFEGVTQVAPGTVETWSIDNNGRAVLTGISTFSKDVISPTASWDPSTQSKVLFDSLKSSVEDRLMSDVPIGIVLSGGLDSSLITAISNKSSIDAGSPPPECWTIAGSEDNPDLLAAESVAQNQDIRLHSSIMEDDIFWTDLPKFAWHGEELDVSVLFWQPLFADMSKNVKVGLCGQGADELHAGYSRYKDLDKHKNIVKSRLELIDKNIFPDINYGPGFDWHDDKIFDGENYDSLQETLRFEMERGQLSNFQLRLADRHSMCFGLEARVPFLGSKHRAESNKLPFNWRISNSNEKMALREAAKHTDLPKEIINRPKLPAGTATAPNQFNAFIDELSPHAKDWAKDYGIMSKLLEKQPDMTIGLRLFHAIHLTERNSPPSNKNILDLLEDVGEWII